MKKATTSNTSKKRKAASDTDDEVIQLKRTKRKNINPFGSENSLSKLYLSSFSVSKEENDLEVNGSIDDSWNSRDGPYTQTN